MSYYDFATLNSTDLEDLFCDLLNASEKKYNSKQVFRTFREGKDKGIDILSSNSNREYHCVGQVKHYFRSGAQSLLSNLEREEVEKVRKLRPTRYLLATSVDLSVDNIKKIKELFAPYILDLTDIYGLKDLNRLIDEYPEVLQRHYKLWFSSTDVLKKIIQYEFYGRSQEFLESNLKRKIRLYVETELYRIARKKIREEKFVIITGEPGCGKTSLAELLLYELIGDDYELNYLLDITDLSKTIRNDDSKQVFYYDDFLGHNAVEIEKAKASEKHFIQTLQRIRARSNKLLILTTRTFILNDAVEGSEKLKRLNLLAKQCTLHLKEYSNSLKQSMLSNHIEESELDKEYKEVLNKYSVKTFITNHKNFYPRSIEFITSADYVVSKSAEEFEKYIYDNFDTPDEIWRHAYVNQIDQADRLLLNTMLSFGDSVSRNKLEKAFNSRINYEICYNNFPRPLNAFELSFNKLVGGFIAFEYFEDNNSLKFINPSLVDFLLRFVRLNPDEVLSIAESVVYTLQLTKRLFPLPKTVENLEVPTRLLERFVDDCNGFLLEDDSDHLRIAMVMISYTDLAVTSSIVYNCLSKIKNWLDLFCEFDSVETLRLSLSRRTLPDKSIENIGVSLYSPIIVFLYDFEKILETRDEMEEVYGFSIMELFALSGSHQWEVYFDEILNEYISDSLEDLKDQSYTVGITDKPHARVYEFKEIVMEWGFQSNPDLQRFSDFEDSKEII
ncbi:ATP-binding protein [Sphingobacterium alkalisoli]|uniref:ATP-binding protein n=1 Tax=Sphingobacterium alkalisoli TaxID=1874115 RepID=A0A4U0GUA6_9SPHI|nr:ATP-binding protein [Sphingobacterium alkalisoli]TJY62548.1 ATP-binding protein [Sphingobacterium alkalisoli]GGH27375.1 hypothetical protein GCM10011418_37270 [Sphingobacterium alkalisoli]